MERYFFKKGTLYKITALAGIKLTALGLVSCGGSDNPAPTGEIYGPPYTPTAVAAKHIEAKTPTAPATRTPTRVSVATPQSGVVIPRSPANRPSYENNQPPVDVKEGPDPQFAQDIFYHTNVARQNFGVPALNYSPQLSSAAQKYAEFLIARYKQGLPLSHLDDGNPQERAAREGYTGGIWENFAGYSMNVNKTAEIWVNNWLGSEGHRANILNPNPRDLGVGCAIGYKKVAADSEGLEDYERICVQDFGYQYEVVVITPTATPYPTPTARPTFTPTPTPTIEVPPTATSTATVTSVAETASATPTPTP